MAEPTLASQLFGIVAIMICLFVALLLIASNEEKRKRQKEEQEKLDQAIIEVYQQGRNQFNNIARENIRNCDRVFTFDKEAPVGLRQDLLALPSPSKTFKEQ